MSAVTSVNNCEYLDMLDRGWRETKDESTGGRRAPRYWLRKFLVRGDPAELLAPGPMVGVEVEGHRLFRDGRARIDYAYGYLAELPNARFVVADYAATEEPADVFTAWFPLLTPAAILAWRLPLTLLAPERLLRQIRHNLRPDGLCFMVNHGLQEAVWAGGCCTAAGLQFVARWPESGPLNRHRLLPPALSWWGRGP